MRNLSKVYILIILMTVVIALYDILFIISNNELIIDKGFLFKSLLLGLIFIIDMYLVKKIDDVFCTQLIKLNLVSESKKEILENHEVSRKLQIMQSYVKMDQLNELELFIKNEVNKDIYG